MTDKIAEVTMVSLVGGVSFGLLPLVLGIPAAAYYSVKTWQLIKSNK